MEIERVPDTKRPAKPVGEADTVISEGITVEGTIRGNGLVRLEGTIDGAVDFDGDLVVARAGVVKGPVAASTLRVAGRIEGNVAVKKHLFLEKTGQIQGDIETAALVVEEGGRINGRTAMTKADDGGDEDAPASEAAAPAREAGKEAPSDSFEFFMDTDGGYSYDN